MDKQHTRSELTQKITIRVTEPLLDSTKSFVTYLISGSDRIGSFQIRRRYNDFFYFRESLRKRWPGLYIPPIPQKKINISGQDDQQMQYRRKFFDYFLKQLATYPHLFSCPITHQFLRNQSLVMEKYYQTVSVPKTADLISQYKQIFPNLRYKETLNENRNFCNNFSSFLKKAQKELRALSAELGVIVQTRNTFIQNLNAINITMLPEYEKNVYAEYLADAKKDPHLLFVNDNKIQDNIRIIKENSTAKPNPFGYFYDMLIFETREIEAFQEALISKQEQESNKRRLQQKCLEAQSQVSKLMGGKFSLKSIFAKGTKNEQIQVLQKQIPEYQKEIELLGQFCQIINCILATVQIPTFKQTKKQQYYEILTITSERQLEYLGVYGQFMKSIMEGLNKGSQTK